MKLAEHLGVIGGLAILFHVFGCGGSRSAQCRTAASINQINRNTYGTPDPTADALEAMRCDALEREEREAVRLANAEALEQQRLAAEQQRLAAQLLGDRPKAAKDDHLKTGQRG